MSTVDKTKRLSREEVVDEHKWIKEGWIKFDLEGTDRPLPDLSPFTVVEVYCKESGFGANYFRYVLAFHTKVNRVFYYRVMIPEKR